MSNEVQKDLVLSINEYAYVEDETKGHVVCWVGPSKTSLSQSDKLVSFDSKTKRFVPCSYENAIKLFTTAPENWYAILKNPAEDNKHPKPGTSNTLPDIMHIGQKINITGPVSFALYPGQMAKVVRGHALRTNQYLLARVYEAKAASNSVGEARDAEGNVIETKQTYVNGQILVIKGTEVSFYIPPTGIEVIPINNDDKNGYIREAVTLERLEYCILKDEDGNKRYVHGPQVVFPEPTETFVTSPKGGYVFRAVELSPISGIYVKVITEYTEQDVVHPVGEELFITGKHQMIYYPRPEHAIITYDGKMMHHAIAIPEGEGRYVMNRLTGEIKTIKGPQMYLPDPRYEVVVKRKLTPHQCELMYPGNQEALLYNINLDEKTVEKSTKTISLDNLAFSVASSTEDTLANLEAKANISRGTSYTKPRTITLDTKYEGAVSVDVWTGYAVNLISKNGNRQVICGPQTVMLDYDQTLEELQLSTGKPKNTDRLIQTCYLRYINNKVGDKINIETLDYVHCTITVSYCIDFMLEHKEKWFNVDNYVKFVCDRCRSMIQKAAKEYPIEEFYQKYNSIIHDVVVGTAFEENGMVISDCEILDIDVDPDIYDLITKHQQEMVKKSLELSTAEKRIKVAEELSVAEQKENALETQKLINKMNLQREEALYKLNIQTEVNRKKEAEAFAEKEAEKDLQALIDNITDTQRARKTKDIEQELAHKNALAAIEKAKQDAYAETVAKIIGSIGPDLAASLSMKANESMVNALTHAVGPYAIAGEESISDVVNKLLRGTPIEAVIDNFKQT